MTVIRQRRGERPDFGTDGVSTGLRPGGIEPSIRNRSSCGGPKKCRLNDERRLELIQSTRQELLSHSIGDREISRGQGNARQCLDNGEIQDSGTTHQRSL
jgi:hypothetical protein